MASKPKVTLTASPGLNLRRYRLALGPTILLCSGEADPGRSHMKMWIPILDEAGVRYAVLARNAKLYDHLVNAFPETSIVLATSPEDVELLVNSSPSIRAVLYTSNTGNNLHLLRFNALRHVFIGNGEGVTPPTGNKVLRAYDEVWTAGQAQLDRIAQADFDTRHLRFRRIGRLDFPGLPTIAAARWQDRFERQQILYLPACEEGGPDRGPTSLYWAVTILSEAAKCLDAKVKIKVPQQTGNANKALKKADTDIAAALSAIGISAQVIGRSKPLSAALKSASVIICDMSPMILECLTADTPIFLHAPGGECGPLAGTRMKPEHFAYMFSNVDDLRKGLKDLMTNGDKLQQQRSEAREYLLGTSAVADEAFKHELAHLSESRYTPTETMT